MPKSEAKDFDAVFQRLRGVLAKHAESLEVTADTPTKYCLDAPIGPATLRWWAGKTRRATIPVAWVEVGKSYVSYHLMGVVVPTVQEGMSALLKGRLHGKTCFNFTATDPAIVSELDALTGASIAAFKKAGFTA